jgi:hypothetical protein
MIKWSKLDKKETHINIENIFTSYPVSKNWQGIYNKSSLLFNNFKDSREREIKIAKENFIFLPIAFTPIFPYLGTTETFYYLKKINITTFEKLENMLNLCLKPTLTAQNIPPFLKMEKIYDVKWKFRKWTIVSCDKNSNIQLPMCPVQYHKDMKKTFIDNNKMFQIIADTKAKSIEFEKGYLIDLHKTHNRQWTHLGKFKKSGQLPTAYTLPKFSDIDKKLLNCRVRPIITYAKFAMKKTLSIVSIGLNFLLSMLDF